MQASDDTRLIEAAQAGDREAFDELVRRHDRGVLRLALRLVGTEDEARDIYQESFLRLFRTLGSFRHDCRFETYLFRIVTNVCLDHLRRRAARPEERDRISRDTDGRIDPLAARPDDSPERDPERALERREIRRRIDTALAGLSPRERLIFELRHYEGLRLREIGERIGTTEKTVKNCLFRAHHHLRSSLQDMQGIGLIGLPRGADPAGIEI